MVKVTVDDAFIESGSQEVIHVDYKNITKVVVPGNRVYIDDGLISLIVKEIGNFNWLLDNLICIKIPLMLAFRSKRTC